MIDKTCPRVDIDVSSVVDLCTPSSTAHADADHVKYDHLYPLYL